MNRWWLAIVLVAWLAGCAGSTPDCGDNATLDILDLEISNEVERLASQIPADGFADMADTYEIDQIRTLAYDESIDSYQCLANVTYEFKGDRRVVELSYRIDTDQGSGDPIVAYDGNLLTQIRSMHWKATH